MFKQNSEEKVILNSHENLKSSNFNLFKNFKYPVLEQSFNLN